MRNESNHDLFGSLLMSDIGWEFGYLSLNHNEYLGISS